MADDVRVGLGVDMHPTAPDRPLFLGGVRFDGEPGLAGHSDADVVCHALADALLGAAALGDIGEHFPEDDPAIAGIGGTELLAKVAALVREAGLEPRSCDVVVLAERPHLAQARLAMRESLSRMIGIPVDAVSVKATRPEGLGLTGDGIGCFAVALVSG
jgi:2-C-methyl-D-erythritol 2,4-cyclodiphosphate synthase